jgi:prolyl-tRNA synthetase
VVADLCRTEINSHKQLPMLAYHIQTKFRDDPRPRAASPAASDSTKRIRNSLRVSCRGGATASQ